MKYKKTVLSTAMAAVLGVSTLSEASAVLTKNINWSGAATFLTSTGSTILNTDASLSGAPFYAGRTAINGTMSFDLASGKGSMTMSSFSFLGSGLAAFNNISLTSIGDGFGNPGTLILGNMSWDWNGNTGIPISVIWDAQGLFNVLTNGFTGPASYSNVSVSQTVTGIGALAATENATFGLARQNYTLPMGPSPIVTTTWNTSSIGSPTLGTNPSGTLPLTDDGIGGSPLQQAAPFNNHNWNFDITSVHFTSAVAPVPVPATIWLLGSGLAGLLGVARRRRGS